MSRREKTFTNKLRCGIGGWSCVCCSPIGNPKGHKKKALVHRAVRRKAKQELLKKEEAAM